MMSRPSYRTVKPPSRRQPFGLIALVSTGVILLTVGCAPSAETGGFDSPHPASRIFASRRAANEPDQARQNIPDLIVLLESDDPAVRLIAIMALERLTGTTRGYRHHDPPWVRAQRVDDWVRAWEDNTIVLISGVPVGSIEDAEPPVQQANSDVNSSGGSP